LRLFRPRAETKTITLPPVEALPEIISPGCADPIIDGAATDGLSSALITSIPADAFSFPGSAASPFPRSENVIQHVKNIFQKQKPVKSAIAKER